MKRMYYVKAIWDPIAHVYYSESDIPGFVVEAATVDAFEDVMWDVIPDLISANVLPKDIDANTWRDFIPSILWQRPTEVVTAA